MTLKEKKFQAELHKPENKLNMAECMRKAGYSQASIRAGSKYKQLRKITRKLDFFDPEKIKKDIALTFRYAKREKDITNMARVNEHRSKIAGMITDKAEVTNVDKQDNQFSLDRLAKLRVSNSSHQSISEHNPVNDNLPPTQ